MKKIFFLIWLLFLNFSLVTQAFGQESEAGQYQLFKSKTFVKNPLDLRDPFKRKINKKKVTQLKNQANLTGSYSNFNQSLEGLPIESMQVIGVVIGTERRAMIRVMGEKGIASIFYVKEGMKVGVNNAEVKAILPGGIVLVEKIRNVYDLDEYIETVLPISE